MRTSGFRADDALWHQRLGHPSRVTLKNCIEAGVFAPGALLRPDGTEVRGTTHPRNCTVCPKGALSHQLFPLLDPGTNRYPKLHKVYREFLNVGHCRINNELYKLTFVDAGMRYVWIVNAKVRNRVYKVFRLWLAHAQRQYGEKLKIWQSDGAAEFKSKELQDYLAQKGIEHHISLPYAHQQQGVAKRTNRMLMTKVRALMKQSKLPPIYWTYAMHHAVRVHNLLSTTAHHRQLVAKCEVNGDQGQHIHALRAWLILNFMSQKVANVRDVIFYEWLFLRQFRQDEQANVNRVYANNGHSYASSEDEVAAPILERDTRGEFTRGDRCSSDDDNDDSLGGGAGAVGGSGSGSGRGAAPPAPPEPEGDDDDSRSFVPRSLPPLLPSRAPPCLPCVDGRQRAAPHSSSFPPTTAPLQTLHMDVWGPARVSGQCRECYFLLVVDDCTRYTTVFPLSSKGEFPDVLIPWIRAVRLQFREREGILQSFTLPESPQKNGIAERHIGLVMEVAHTSMIHAAAPHFLWPFAVRYAAHQLNLWPRVSLPETSPTLRWTGKVGDASVFRGPAPSSAARGATSGGAASEGAGSGGAEPGGEEPGGAEPASVEPGGSEPEGVEPRGAESQGAESRGAEPRGTASSGATGGGDFEAGDTRVGGAGVTAGASGTGGAAPVGPGGARTRGTGAAGTRGVGGARVGDPTEPGAAGAGGAGGTGAGGAGAGGAGAVDPGVGGAGGTVRPSPASPASPLPAPSPYTEQTGGLIERREPASRLASPVRTVCRVPRPRPPPVPGTHAMALSPSSVPLRLPLPPPPESSLPAVPDPESDRARAASPTVSRLLATVVTYPSFESTVVSTLVAELVYFAAACRLDYATTLVADSESASPPSVGGECALGTDVLEDKKKDFECLAAAVPRFASMLVALEGDPDAPDIPTPRSYAEAITVPPSRANIVDGMWIFRVKWPPGSPPAFKARYVARGFSKRQGVDYFKIFSPTPKMTTLRVLLHVAAQRDYELHSLDFSTTFLQGSLHEEIWLRRPPGFTGTTLAALGFAPSADQSLFLRTATSLPAFYVLVYVDDLVFATADTEALTLVKSKLQKRHTCTDLGELRSYLGLQITQDRARHTITLAQSHMVHQFLQLFGFQFSSPQPTPLSTGHSLSAPPSDESVEPSGPYPELVGCLLYLMTCTQPDIAYSLSLLARYVAPGRHQKVHWDAAKRVLRYLCCTSGMGLVLGGRGPVVLTGHADSSWVDDSATQRSSQGYTFSLGSGSVSWRSTRSSLVLSSSCEAEIYAGAMAAQELRWLTYLRTNLGEQPCSPPVCT
ncbi:unnamed protein product [Closterium sp. NIES-54]